MRTIRATHDSPRRPFSGQRVPRAALAEIPAPIDNALGPATMPASAAIYPPCQINPPGTSRNATDGIPRNPLVHDAVTAVKARKG